MILELGTLAAEARTSLYALKLDNQMFDIADCADADQPVRRSAGAIRRARAARRRGARDAVHRDRHRPRRCSSASNRRSPATTCSASNRTPRTRTARRTRCGSTCRASGAIVRSRRHVLNTPRPIAARAARVAAPGGRGGARARRCSSSALPLRVASFSLQGPERDKVQLLIHADIGTDYASSKVVSVGYVITDRERPHGGQQGRRHAAAADHDRRAVAAAVHGGREPAARASTR